MKLSPTKVTLVTMRFHDLAATAGVDAVDCYGREGREQDASLRFDFDTTPRRTPSNPIHRPTDHINGDSPLRFPEASALNISSSATGFTLGMGTDHFPAFSARFCFTVLDSTCRGGLGGEGTDVSRGYQARSGWASHLNKGEWCRHPHTHVHPTPRPNTPHARMRHHPTPPKQQEGSKHHTHLHTHLHTLARFTFSRSMR